MGILKKIVILALTILPCQVFYAQFAGLPNEEEQKQLEKAMLATPAVGNLNESQKKHFQIYAQVKKLRRQGKYNKEQVFQPIFKPVNDFFLQNAEVCEKQVNHLRKKLAEIEEAYTNLAQDDSPQSKLKRKNLQAQSERIEEYALQYKEIVDIAKKFFKEYPKKRPNNLQKLMADYRATEQKLIMAKQPIPKRTWLSSVEAELLIRQVEANQNKKSQPKNAPKTPLKK
ncbi:MAG: hypothetical protein IJJ26_03120 [Victivallales bacterium]|nr:hypothetical protein [Victivallales bacterium]